MAARTASPVVSRLRTAVAVDGPPPLAAAKFRLRPKRRKILADTAARLLAGEDPDTVVLPQLYRSLSAERIVDASLGFVVTELEAGMRLAFVEGFPEEIARRCLRLDFGQAVCGTVAATGKAMHVSDIQQSLDPLADLVRSAGISAYACEPLIVGDQLLGTLSFASKSRRRFDAEDLIFFRAIAEYVAKARHRARKLLSSQSAKAPV